MKKVLASLVFSCLFLNVFSQDEKINFHINTATEEAEYVWNLLKDLSFYNTYHYNLSLPDHSFIDILKGKALKNKLVDADYDTLIQVFTNDIYHTEDYTKGLLKVCEGKKTVMQIFPVLEKYERRWGFKTFKHYQVNLTLYGPGGRYNSEDGNILLMTSKNGTFRGNRSPEEIIIHEIVHIGIEEPIASRFKLWHTAKERLVDLFVLAHFHTLLTDYTMQGFGDKRLDSCFPDKKSWKHLPEKISEFTKNNDSMEDGTSK